MARITVEDCLEKVNNRFALIHLAAQRVRQYRQGLKTSIRRDNKEVVMSLREVASGDAEFDAPPAIVRPASRILLPSGDED